MVDFDSFCLDLALKEAWKYQGLTFPNPPVGAVIVNNFEILSINAHKIAGEPHAEVLALKDAFLKLNPTSKLKNIFKSDEIHNYLIQNHNNIFRNSTIYITLEPCNHYGKTPPCSNLIKELQFSRVVIATMDKNREASGGFNFLKESNINIEIIEKREALELIEPFNLWQNGTFRLYKLAQRLNGSIDNGYISSKNSLNFVHKLRDKVELLVISGETVRVDRPTLNAINGTPPNILIVSSKKDFDKTIPLFSIPNREVFIENSFEKVKDYKYVLFEGGAKFFEVTKDIIDWYLFFIAPTIQNGLSLSSKTDLKILNLSLEDDIKLWCKREF